MERIRKMAAVAAAVILSLVARPVQAGAQVITNDPLLLAQQIIQICQDADMSGWFDDGPSSLSSAIEQYENLKEKIEDMKIVMSFISDGKKLVSEVVSTSDLMLDTYRYIDAFKSYYQTDDSSYSYVYLNNCESIYRGFFQVANGLEEEFNSMLDQLKQLKRGESVNIMQVAGELAEQFHDNVLQLSYAARTRCGNTYLLSSAQRESDSAKEYLKAFIY